MNNHAFHVGDVARVKDDPTVPPILRRACGYVIEAADQDTQIAYRVDVEVGIRDISSLQLILPEEWLERLEPDVVASVQYLSANATTARAAALVAAILAAEDETTKAWHALDGLFLDDDNSVPRPKSLWFAHTAQDVLHAWDIIAADITMHRHVQERWTAFLAAAAKLRDAEAALEE